MRGIEDAVDARITARRSSSDYAEGGDGVYDGCLWADERRNDQQRQERMILSSMT